MELIGLVNFEMVSVRLIFLRPSHFHFFAFDKRPPTLLPHSPHLTILLFCPYVRPLFPSPPPLPLLRAYRYVLTFDQASDAPCLVTLAQHGDPLLPVGFYVINKDGETTGKGAFMHAPEVACQVKLLPQFQPYVGLI
jgi:hypothetical protein